MQLKELAKHLLWPAVQFSGPDRLNPERVAEPDGHPHRLQHHHGHRRHPPTPRHAHCSSSNLIFGVWYSKGWVMRQNSFFGVWRGQIWVWRGQVWGVTWPIFGGWRGQVCGVAWPSLGCGVSKFGMWHGQVWVWRGQVWGVAWKNLGCGVAKFGVWRGQV